MTSLDWNQIDSITQGRAGRTMAVCPLCSESRRTPQKRHSNYYCNHCGANGYVHPDRPSRRVVDLAEQQRHREKAKQLAEQERQERIRQAFGIWKQSQPFRGSPAEDYLHHIRGIGEWLDTFPRLDQVFRYHPNCPFGGEYLPCMLAAVRDIKTDKGVAIHRTALTTDNPPQRIDRKSLGPVGGGAIKISPNDEVHSGLLIGEGIETVLSASKSFKFKPVWVGRLA
jgi:hypothetical protein